MASSNKTIYVNAKNWTDDFGGRKKRYRDASKKSNPLSRPLSIICWWQFKATTDTCAPAMVELMKWSAGTALVREVRIGSSSWQERKSLKPSDVSRTYQVNIGHQKIGLCNNKFMILNF